MGVLREATQRAPKDAGRPPRADRPGARLRSGSAPQRKRASCSRRANAIVASRAWRGTPRIVSSAVNTCQGAGSLGIRSRKAPGSSRYRHRRSRQIVLAARTVHHAQQRERLPVRPEEDMLRRCRARHH